MPAKNYQTITLEADAAVATLWLNRPQVKNAFNDRLLQELGSALDEIAADASVRVLIVSGKGDCFCAGADLEWMRSVVDYTLEENLKDSQAIADVFFKLYSLPKPTIAAVNGPAIGGGMGFVGACDMVLASQDAKFGLSEVRLGLVPACIGPYVLRRVPAGRLRRYFLTGDRFGPETALALGLIDEIVPASELMTSAQRLAQSLLAGAPMAQAKAKELLERVPGLPLAEAIPYTVEMIARLRAGAEAQKGMREFLEKKPTPRRS
jgi:methylglutaconyl-CoA hydratase